MNDFYIGLIMGQNQSKQTQELVENIETGLKLNGVKYTYVSDVKSDVELREMGISMLLGVNELGPHIYGNLTYTAFPFVFWGFQEPLSYYTLYRSFSTKTNLIVLSKSVNDISYLSTMFEKIRCSQYSPGYDPRQFVEEAPEKEYDLVYIGSITDIDEYEKEMKDNLSADAYEIFSEIVDSSCRNPEASLFDLFRNYAKVYRFDETDFELYQDVYNKIKEHISSLIKLKVLENMDGNEVKIWGPKTWEKYTGKNMQYMGEEPEKGYIDILRKSKIALNIDNVRDLMSITPYCLNVMASNTLLLTNNNISMQKYFPRSFYNIYYDPNKNLKLSEMINHYLKNEDDRLEIALRLKTKVENEHTWQVRIRQLVAMFTGVN